MARFRTFILSASAGFAFFTVQADQLNLTNGDRYVGTIELVNAKEVHLQSEVVGLLKVPRAKVTSIYFGTNAPTAAVAAAVVAVKKEEAKTEFDPKVIEQVQQQFLGTATPEANDMFNDMVKGLASGKLSVEDLRKQASDALKELRDLQSDGGEDAAEEDALLSSYVGILERFVKQGQSSTNRVKLAAPKAPIEETPKPDDE